MEIELIVLTKSSKYGGFCVAGLEVKTGKWIRLVSNNSLNHNTLMRENLLYYNNRELNVLDMIRVKIIKCQPTIIHPENVLIDEEFNLTKIKSCTIDEALSIHPCENHSCIFGNLSHVICADIGNVGHSLELIWVENLQIHQTENLLGKLKTKASFLYNGVSYNRFSVTDPCFYSAVDGIIIKKAILVVSLPDDDWSEENGYYKFVAKIFPF